MGGPPAINTAIGGICSVLIALLRRAAGGWFMIVSREVSEVYI